MSLYRPKQWRRFLLLLTHTPWTMNSDVLEGVLKTEDFIWGAGCIANAFYNRWKEVMSSLQERHSIHIGFNMGGSGSWERRCRTSSFLYSYGPHHMVTLSLRRTQESPAPSGARNTVSHLEVAWQSFSSLGWKHSISRTLSWEIKWQT